MNNDNEQKRQFEELKEAIKHVTELLPPEYAKISLRLFAEDLLGTVIKIPKDLPFEETIQKIMKLILSESNRTDGEASSAETTETEKPENVETKRVQKAIVMTAKIPDTLFDTSKNSVFENNKAVSVWVGDKKQGNKEAIEVRTIVTLNYDKLLELVKIDNPQILLNPEARVIHDAIVNIYYAGNRYFDWQMIYQVKTAYRQEHPRITQQEQQTQSEILNRLITARVTIDASEEAQYFGYDGGNEENYLIPAKREEFYKNGRKISGFIFLDEPPLLKYCRRAKQIEERDINLLALPNAQEQKINASMQTLIIRDYLFERIVKMLNPNNHMENTIKLDTLFNYIGLEAQNKATLRSKKRYAMQTIRTLLNNWQAKGLILGFQEITEKSSGVITKIKIILPELALKGSKSQKKAST